jgi:hypothetical protein
MSGFDCTESTLPTVVAALLDSSVNLLRELYAERGCGPWVDELHQALRNAVKNQDFTGIPLEAEAEQVEAGLRAVDTVFAFCGRQPFRCDQGMRLCQYVRDQPQAESIDVTIVGCPLIRFVDAD